MRSRLTGLRRQVHLLEKKIGRPGNPLHWFFLLPTGADVPECIKKQMRTADTWCTRWVPADYFFATCGDDAVGSCVVMAQHNNFIVDMHTGAWERVIKFH
jgi:hypothetical protein